MLGLMSLLCGGAIITWWIQKQRRSADHPACGSCGYNVTGTLGMSSRCPECGSDFATVGVVPPGGWRTPKSNAALAFIFIFMLLNVGLAAQGFMRGSASRKAAMAALQQAVAQSAAAQAASRPSATMPIATTPAAMSQPFEMPPPLTVDQITAMTKEEARAALYQRAIAEKLEPTGPVRNRLANERRMLIEHLKGEVPTSQPASAPLIPLFDAPAGPPPVPLTQADVDAMTKDQARAALYQRAVAEKYVGDAALKDRLTRERRMLIERLKKRDSQ